MNTGVNLLFCFAMFISQTDAFYLYVTQNCHFDDGHDALLTSQLYFNKKLTASYNSTEGKFTGYTDTAKKFVAGFNKDQPTLDQEKKNLDNCKATIPKIQKTLEIAVSKPNVRLIWAKTASSHHPGIIICSAYNFYPKHITLTWFRNGKEVTSDFTSTDEMSDGNWVYQKHSYLEYTPTLGDNITCMVEHASLSKPELYILDYTLESVKTKITVGTAGLLLGLAFTTVGVIYYKKHTKGHVLVPTF